MEGSKKDTSPLSTIFHILALVLSEDSSTRKIWVENGLIGVTLDLLTNFMPNNLTREKVAVLKWVTSLLLILDHTLQCKLQLPPDVQNIVAIGGNSLESESKDTTLVGVGAMDNSEKSSLDENIKGNSPFMNILGNPLGYMKKDEQHREMNISCGYTFQQL